MERLLDANLQLLRTRIESDLQRSSVILVTSALPGDGKSVTAYGLADSLSQAGRRVALVDGNVAPLVATAPLPPNADTKIPLVPLPFDDQDPTALAASVGHFVRQMREEYDFTVIDGAPFTRGNAQMLFAGAVDGVLLTVRLGRAQREDDQLMCQMLDHAKAHLLGVVAVSSAAIAAFNPQPPAPQRGRDRGRSREKMDGNVVASTGLARS